VGIKKRPDGRWRARIIGDDGRERAKHFQRKADAVEWEASQLAARARGTWIDPRDGRVTFHAFFQEWSARQVWESGTVKAMNLAVNGTTFRDMPLARIRRSHVEVWVKAMSAADLASSTIRTRFNNARNVFRAAVRDKAIATDPTEGVALPRLRRRDAAMMLPSSEQVGCLLQSADESFATFLALCAFAGLRLGEAAAVQVDDIDFLGRTLKVTRQVQRADGGAVEIRPPKYHSERTVFLPDDLLTLLGQHVAGRELWLFTGQGDCPPHQNTVGYRWRKTCERAKVAGFTLHDLRHFYASGLIAAGCDVVTVQRALGHATPTTTLNTYSHLWPTAEDRTRRAAAGLMAAVSGLNPDQDRITSG
jgi:integrase